METKEIIERDEIKCIHCNNESKFERWEELEYNDGADEPHTGGNYLIFVKYIKCLQCGEIL